MSHTTTPLDALAFPLSGSHLIEASAGTGKTYTLALLYVRLILGHGDTAYGLGRALSPRDILVMTFTESAAEELRDRIRSRLVEAAHYFYERTPARAADDPIERLRSSYDRAEWNLCAWKLQTAAESMDEAQVSTTHSWCHQVLVEQAFDTRGLFNRQLVSETQDLLAEVVRDYWRIHFQSLSEAEAGLIQDKLKSPADLQNNLRELLSPTNEAITYQGEPLSVRDLQSHLDDNLRYAQDAAQAEQDYDNARQAQKAHEREVQAHWLAHWPQIESHLLALRTSLKPASHKSGSIEEFQAHLATLHAWAQGSAKAPALLKNYAQGRFKFLKNKPFSQEDDLPAFALLKQWLDQDKPSKAQITPPAIDIKAAVLAHAQPWVEQTLHQRMRQRAEMSFDDLLIELDRALDPSNKADAALRLASSLRERFPVALIDEFQDTDPIQYRIIDRIYALADNRPETGLVMIGDPKQAIYSFRGADIYTYLQARSAIDERIYTLETNFRSSQALVSACNALFTHAEQHARAAFRFQTDGHNPLPFIQAKANGRDETLYLPSAHQTTQAAQALTFWYIAPEDDDEGALATGRYRQLAAESTASQIAEWLRAAEHNQAGFGQDQTINQALRPGDIAILVRTATEAKAVRKAMQKRRIASVYLSDRESLFASQEAMDVLHWLQACANPLDERLVKAALGTNSLAIALEQLAQWQVDELAWEAQMLHFQQLHTIWQRQGVLVMLNALLERFDLPTRLMQQNNGERRLTNLLHVAEWLQQASNEFDGEQALIRHLIAYLQAGDQEQILRLESDAERVQVITIHKAKGLDYPLVMLPFISSWRDINGKQHQVSVHQGHHKTIEIAGKDRFKSAWEQANDERISEDMRLLYVALTRAQHALWLGVAALKSGNVKTPQVERSALGYLLNAGEPLANAFEYEQHLRDLANQHDAIHLDNAPTPNTSLAPARAERSLEPARTAPALPSIQPWWIASYSAIHFQSDGQSDAAVDNDTAQQDQLEEESRLAQSEQSLTDVSSGVAMAQTAHPLSADNVLHQFPAGATWGTVLHSLIEWAAQQTYTPLDAAPIKGFAAVVKDNVDSYARFVRFCEHRRIEAQFIEPLWQWLVNFIATPWALEAVASDARFALRDLQPAHVAVEMEFMIESHAVATTKLDALVCDQLPLFESVRRPAAKPNWLNGMLKGFIDLVAEHQGRYYVIDWKSNRLGLNDADYSHAAMRQHMGSHRYDLQYVLYLLALHRQLKARLPGYDYDTHVGGAIYVFLRGTHNAQTGGLFYDKPPKALIEALDALFAHAPQGQPA